MAELKDSGNRRDFGTGAVRDMAEGKGRCDLLPLDIIHNLFDHFVEMEEYDDFTLEQFCGVDILDLIDMFQSTNNTNILYDILCVFIHDHYEDKYTAILELAKHYEDGAKKYSDNNWKNGIPVKFYIDSGVRHYLKFCRGDKDEPHDRAFMWNIVGALWTIKHKPRLNDYALEKWEPKETLKGILNLWEENASEYVPEYCEFCKHGMTPGWLEPCNLCRVIDKKRPESKFEPVKRFKKTNERGGSTCEEENTTSNKPKNTTSEGR